MIIEERANTKLLSLTQIENKNFYTYYCDIEVLLIEIAGKNWVTYNGKNAVILNKAK